MIVFEVEEITHSGTRFRLALSGRTLEGSVEERQAW